MQYFNGVNSVLGVVKPVSASCCRGSKSIVLGLELSTAQKAVGSNPENVMAGKDPYPFPSAQLYPESAISAVDICI